jgi:amino acid transporter
MKPTKRTTKVVVVTSVMLSFISFWRAAAIVLNDLGSSAFYVGGIAEQAIGHAAPWFIFGVMLFSYAVRAVYIESCGMFTRGGVYRVVKEAMGGTLAKLSVSALMFDYILTGPISSVSAGQYIVGLVAHTATHFGHTWAPSKAKIDLLAAGLAVVVTLYFWRRNTKGIHESSDDALRIMYVTTVMIALLIGWCGLTIFTHPAMQRLPPTPAPDHLTFNRDAVGWLPRIMPGALRQLSIEAPPATIPAPEKSELEPLYGLVPNAGVLFGLIGILIAFGHSFLAMSGEESLAQVNRELEFPKHKNLVRAGFVIFAYSLLLTSLVSFFAYAMIPDSVRPQYFDNLISGIAVYVMGPPSLTLLFQAFIVIVGFLMLSGAVNTAIIGSNGVLNRVSEDGVLTDWFREPHKKYGTTHRMINLIVVLQLATIAGSRGNIYILGEAYAFGVIWSFAFKGLAMVVLRFKDKSPREWRVPFNINLGGNEIPIGLGVIAALLFSMAGINFVTKEVATISGVAFSLIFFIIFEVSERINQRKQGKAAHVEMDQFQTHPQENVSNESLGARAGNTLCFVDDYHTLDYVRKALELTDTDRKDLIVMTVQILKGPDTGYKGIAEHRLFTKQKQLLFTHVVALAEKEGRPVHLLVVPSSSVHDAIARTAAQLESAEVIDGPSPVLSPEGQAKRFRKAWEKLPNRPKYQILFRIIEPGGNTRDFLI